VCLHHEVVGPSFGPEVDAAHAQHGASQRRAVPELELVGDVTLTDVDLDAWRWISAECDALYPMRTVLHHVYRGWRTSQRVAGTRR